MKAKWSFLLPLFPLPLFAMTWNVYTVSDLNTAVQQAKSSDEIVVHPGAYKLTQTLNFNIPGIILRGSTANYDDVILLGGGMNVKGVDEGISIAADGITVKHITLKDFYFNAIHIRAENDADHTVILNVKTWNIGERHIKGSRDPDSRTKVSDNTLIEKVYMLQTIPRTGHPDTHPDYIGGIDIMSSDSITIRDCRAEGILGSQYGGNAAVFLWEGIQNAVVERNVITGCAKGIALGNPAAPAANLNTGSWHASRAIVRNNIIRRGNWTTGNNIAIELATAKNVEVYHNTIYSDNVNYFRTISFYEAQPGMNSGNIFSCNIIRGKIFNQTTGGWQNTNNIIDSSGTAVTPVWFANTPANDFHLTAAAGAAIDQVNQHVKVPDDMDKQSRPIGTLADIGADEYAAVTSVDELIFSETIKIYPNPALEEINIELPSVEKGLFRIINDPGEQWVPVPVSGVRINISALLPGVYFLEIWLNERRYIRKLVKL